MPSSSRAADVAKSGIKWRGGRDMSHLKMRLASRRDDLKSGAERILEQSVDEGAALVQDLLEAAVTPTGLEREAKRGGFPGRHDTGNMVGSVSSEVRNRRSRRVTGVFGWWGQNYEQYIRDQDLGEGNIPAARALPQAYYRTRDRFAKRMRDLIKGKEGR